MAGGHENNPSAVQSEGDGLRSNITLTNIFMPDKPNNAAASAPLSLKDMAVEKAGALHMADSVERAGDRMREHAANSWPVVESDRKLVGMVDQVNPDWEISGHGHDPKAWKVGEIMTRDVIFCYEDEPCAQARALMEQNDLAYLPVVDREMRIVGIFSRDEIQEKAGLAKADATTLQES